MDKLVTRNPEAPHRAVIWLTAEVHELLQTGECSGMSTFSIKSFPLFVDGINQADAINRLNTLISDIKDKCKQGKLS